MKNLKWRGKAFFINKIIFLFLMMTNLSSYSQEFNIITELADASQFKMIELNPDGYLVFASTRDTINDELLDYISAVKFDLDGDTMRYNKYRLNPNIAYFNVDVSTRINDSLLVFAIEERNIETDSLYCKLIWTNNIGDTIQTRQFSSPYYTASTDPANTSWWMRPTSITKSDDGQFLYLVCRVVDYPPIQNSFIVMKLTHTGELVWTYHQPFDDNYYACDAVVFHQGNPWIIVAGVGGTNYPNLLLGLNDESGVAEVEIALPQGLASSNRRASEMTMLEDGVVIASVIFGEGSNLTPSIYKMSYNGELLWQSLIPNSEHIEQDNDHLVQAQDGGFVCAAVNFEGGPTQGVPDDYNYVYRTWLWKVDANGNFLWDRKFEYLSLDSAYFNVYTFPHDLKATPDGGFIVAGEATTTCSNYPTCDQFIQQGWLLKVDACGCLVPGCDPNCIVSVEETQVDNEKKYFRFGPNPVGETLNIFLASDEHINLDHATLELRDLMGRLIRSLPLPHNNTTYIIDAQSLTAGNYFITLTKDGQVLQSEKMVKR